MHPNLILTKAGAETLILEEAGPLYLEAFAKAQMLVDKTIEEGFDVPWPKDMAGGYSHERHKENYKLMQKAGELYQITGQEKYAEFVEAMLIEYAEMYPKLPIHPTNRSYATGKLFWQCLNDSNWLVYTSQAYDNVYNYINPKTRKFLEADLFKPYADFISIENPKFFNRVHNHSTWGNAAVGMIGIVINDEALIERALYGIKFNENDALAKDNDGGFIYEKGISTAGFFAQLDHAFSPMGYYTEGPYYQRYAMTPFMLFAQALENYKPELKIFDYRDQVLTKAVYALLYQTDQAGQFFPINDAQKGMSYLASSVITAVNIAYGITGDPQLLDVASKQNAVLIDHNGYAIAKGVSEGLAIPFHKRSIELTDGKDGENGGLGILRTSREGKDEICLVYKYTSQGLGHGHYDKLSYALYQGETEVLQDYGAARWVNIDQKAGGRYLKENFSWAKQTVAHNALVMDRKSHFNGEYKNAKDAWSIPLNFDVKNPDLQMVSAMDSLAYPNTIMKRTFWLWNNPAFSNPLVIDLMQFDSDKNHNFEMPYQFSEHLLKTSFDLTRSVQPAIMGEDHGFQHLYEEASTTVKDDWYQFNWFNDSKLYTLTGTSASGDQFTLARLGANDPNFNLRPDAMLLHKKIDIKNGYFLSIIESHGQYSPVSEIPYTPYSEIKSLDVRIEGPDYLVLDLTHINDQIWRLFYCHSKEDTSLNHQVEIEGKKYSWEGAFNIIELKE